MIKTSTMRAPEPQRYPGASRLDADARARATDLPVLLPSAQRLATFARSEGVLGLARLRLQGSHGIVLAIVFVVACGVAQAQGASGGAPILETIWKWTPLLAWGFVFNLVISFLAM